LVRGFNLRFAGRPRYVALCGDTAQVQREVQAALDAGLPLTVKSGGHCYEGFSVENDGGVILDMSPMGRVYRDDTTGLYCIEAGASLWHAYVTLYQLHGVTIPGGSCYSVGAGGHILGGGYGALSRLYGLTVDYLHAVELVHVTADRRAEIVVARRDDPDPAVRALLWAHQGGGGGNFGVATKLWFEKLPAAPAEARLLHMTWDWSRLDQAAFARLLRAYGTFFATHGAPDSPYAGLSADLDVNHKSAGQIELGAQYVGDRPEILDDFIAAVGQDAHTTEVRRMPWLFAAQTQNSSGPNRYGKYKSAFMNRPFPDHQIDTLWHHLTAEGYANPTATVSVVAYGGRVNAVHPAATAHAHRSSILLLQYLVFWTDPADEAENLRWIRGVYDAMYGPRGPFPDGTMDGCFINYPDVDLVDWQTLYYKDNYPALRAIKGRWNPLDVFHHRQSIELPGP
jgi:FAD/FMN-containing dehydrogenase